ncbi:MAG: aldose epimerase family protein [Opitutus sp.]
MSPTPFARPFGQLASGEKIECWTLRNQGGARVEILTYGGIVRSLEVPDRRGQLSDVVLGFASLEPYLAGHPYFGAITGRIAGRVAGGQLLVSGREYPLVRNNGANHLHGGIVGFDKRVWRAEPIGAAALRLSYHSPDGEEGYPGALDVAVTYTLTRDNTLIVASHATSDRPSPLNLAHHSYFNLAGEASGSIQDHQLEIFADTCVLTDETFALSGQRTSLDGHPADFRRRRRLGDAMPGLFQQHGGFYPLRPPYAKPPATPTLAARVSDPQSGRVLDVRTDDLGIQLYTASMLDGALVGKSGTPYGKHRAFCLECQGHPDGTRWPEFGDILVYPERPQKRTTIYEFSTG